jgi:hypothetical protein
MFFILILRFDANLFYFFADHFNYRAPSRQWVKVKVYGMTKTKKKHGKERNTSEEEQIAGAKRWISPPHGKG